ncbi:hypothetical protein EV699_10175 [Plasticicumulans lactativorans]|uniref:Tetratricopeptide repeat protein 38 n=1 Tax=Plasticicumulans lactativorans TaxID=1133106 RepID=A0A4R2LG41_9GAMM|nr:tetratricopeptide repeat protein [Plasticicumulans lactativorans]TCO83691.1 hypothetical protein EV699_10175 [Plasticicumulans lactativorans]
MSLQDALDLRHSGATATALEHFDTALHELQCYIGDPVASVDRALAAAPAFVDAHLLRAYLHLLGTEQPALAAARASWLAARELPANARERGHLHAVRALCEGRWHAAGRALEDVSIDHPTDVLALQAGHLIDFYTGHARMLRDRIARALPAWSPALPGYHAVLGMHAFGLEETGFYARAEAVGRHAVELEPRDGWAQHAVAHVMEMQGRARDGIAWMRGNVSAWSQESFFAVHNWWHWALFHLDLGETGAVLALYDAPIRGARSGMVLDMIDAAALLWRLRLRGIDVGERWQELADAWLPHAAAGNYAFNDVHAAMAFVGADRREALATLAAAQAEAERSDDDNAAFTREVGRPLTQALLAFAAGDYRRVVEALRPLRPHAQRFGGSHAQRDLIDLTLIEAALRDGEAALARALVAERLDLKPDSPANRALAARAAPRVAATA